MGQPNPQRRPAPTRITPPQKLDTDIVALATPTPTPDPTPTPAPPNAEGEKPKRTRSAVSLEKKLAVALSQLVSFVKGQGLVDPIIDAAEVLAGDISAKTIGPIDARLATITARIKVLTISNPDDAEELGKLSQEIKRLNAKRKTVTG